MDVQIYTRNLELTERLQEYVEQKVEKFERYLPSIEGVRIDLSAANSRDASRRMVAQITIYVPRAILRAEERSGDIFAAVDAVIDKMYRRIKRYKGRRLDRKAEALAELLPDDLATEEPELEVEPYNIVRVKQFDVSSITPVEAVEQMELLGHYFFVFLDATDGQLSVVYKREAGDYGLIKPTY